MNKILLSVSFAFGLLFTGNMMASKNRNWRERAAAEAAAYQAELDRTREASILASRNARADLPVRVAGNPVQEAQARALRGREAREIFQVDEAAAFQARQAAARAQAEEASARKAAGDQEREQATAEQGTMPSAAAGPWKLISSSREQQLPQWEEDFPPLGFWESKQVVLRPQSDRSVFASNKGKIGIGVLGLAVGVYAVLPGMGHKTRSKMLNDCNNEEVGL